MIHHHEFGAILMYRILTLKHFREFEKVSKKIINTRWSINFYDICIKKGLWPTYIQI